MNVSKYLYKHMLAEAYLSIKQDLDELKVFCSEEEALRLVPELGWSFDRYSMKVSN